MIRNTKSLEELQPTPLTSLHFLLVTSNNQASPSVLLSVSSPPVTSRWGCWLPKPRQQAAWDDLPSGHGSPSSLSSLEITWMAKHISMHNMIAMNTTRTCNSGKKTKTKQTVQSLHQTFHISYYLRQGRMQGGLLKPLFWQASNYI